MKLSHDCIRDLMLYLEENLDLQDEIDATTIPLDAYNEDALVYTALKLVEAGYISGQVYGDICGASGVRITGITWAGHNFLDTIRDNEVWTKTKSILKKVSSASVSFVSTIASQVLSNLINQYTMGITQNQSM